MGLKSSSLYLFLLLYQSVFSEEKRNHLKIYNRKKHKTRNWLHRRQHPHKDSQITQRLGTARSHYYSCIGRSWGGGGVTDSRLRSHHESWKQRKSAH